MKRVKRPNWSVVQREYNVIAAIGLAQGEMDKGDMQMAGVYLQQANDALTAMTRAQRKHFAHEHMDYVEKAQAIEKALHAQIKPNPMMLMTKEILAQIPKFGAQENVADPIVYVKFFTPDSNWTWLATEFDGQDTFFGFVQGFEGELGYFSLSELQSATGPAGLHIERDKFFKPQPLSVAKAKLGIQSNPGEKWHRAQALQQYNLAHSSKNAGYADFSRSHTRIGNQEIYDARKSREIGLPNPGKSWHRAEQARYEEMMAGDLKAGHGDAADYWHGAASAEMKDAMASVEPNPCENPAHPTDLSTGAVLQFRITRGWPKPVRGEAKYLGVTDSGMYFCEVLSSDRLGYLEIGRSVWLSPNDLVKEGWMNQPEVYVEEGKKAGEAMRQRDLSRAQWHLEWFTSAVSQESPENQREARRLFDDSYREGAAYLRTGVGKYFENPGQAWHDSKAMHFSREREKARDGAAFPLMHYYDGAADAHRRSAMAASGREIPEDEPLPDDYLTNPGDTSIAETILQQLGGGRLRMMTGAKNFVALDNGLMFMLPRAKGGINKVIVKLNGLDLYDIEFDRIRGVEYKVIATANDVYAENLQDVFTEHTGLYTHM
jgi:hypothetical protein